MIVDAGNFYERRSARPFLLELQQSRIIAISGRTTVEGENEVWSGFRRIPKECQAEIAAQASQV
jgi:hypothetical protein